MAVFIWCWDPIVLTCFLLSGSGWSWHWTLKQGELKVCLALPSSMIFVFPCIYTFEDIIMKLITNYVEGCRDICNDICLSQCSRLSYRQEGGGGEMWWHSDWSVAGCEVWGEMVTSSSTDQWPGQVNSAQHSYGVGTFCQSRLHYRLVHSLTVQWELVQF